MSAQSPDRGILDRITDAVARLFGFKAGPAPVLVPVQVRRQTPIQIPIRRR